MKFEKGFENGQNKSGEFEDARKPENFDDVHTAGLLENYDRDNADIKKALTPEVYEAKRSRDISEQMANYQNESKLKKEIVSNEETFNQEFQEANQLLENRTEEYFKSLIEKTTGLKRREALYKDMDREISLAFGVEDIKDISEADLRKFIKECNPDDYKDRELNVMMGDMAYLSLANEEGHREGDALLGQTGKAIKSELRDASRHGGDEFSALVKLSREKSQEIVDRLEKAIKNGSNISILERNNLKPRLDIGLAHFSEGIKVFKEVITEMEKTEAGIKKLDGFDILKEFEDTWLEIADKRSSLKKAFERVKLLVSLKSDKDSLEIYEEVINSLRKGALGIKDEEVDDLIGSIEAGGETDDLVNEYIARKEKANISRLEGHKLIRAKIINELVA